MIWYTSGYRYRLEMNYSFPTELPACAGNVFVKIDKDGVLHIAQGYAWDGASGPAINTRNFVRGSLVHDALYQLIRECNLPPGYRKTADEILRRVVREDGMFALRAWWVYAAVRLFGGYHMRRCQPRIRSAP